MDLGPRISVRSVYLNLFTPAGSLVSKVLPKPREEHWCQIQDLERAQEFLSILEPQTE